MSGYAFDSAIVIDLLLGVEQARAEFERALERRSQPWISRLVWLEVMSRCTSESLRATERFLAGFGIDELDGEISDRAASLRRERPGLATPDAIMLATAQIRGRIFVTRNTKDFPANMPGIRVPYTLSDI